MNLVHILQQGMDQTPFDWFVAPSHVANRLAEEIAVDPQMTPLFNRLQDQLLIDPKWSTGTVRLYVNDEQLLQWITSHTVTAET